MSSDEQAMLGGRLSNQSKEEAFQAGDSQQLPRTRNGADPHLTRFLSGLSMGGPSQTLKESDF